MAYFQFVEDQKEQFENEITTIKDKIERLENFNSDYDDMISEVHYELRNALEEIMTDKIDVLFAELEIEDDGYNSKHAEIMDSLMMEFNL